MHPRPQLVRSDWSDLSGQWGFAHDDDDVGLTDGWYESDKPFDRTITVPFPPESKLSGIHDTGYHPVVWYRSELKVPGPPDGQRLLLHFGAVDYRATVWVDGVRVADHEGGHTPFSCDITHALGNGSKHSIVVRAEDQPT
ncbi:MAG TPA: glycoside hydrolase family 2, partial [Candidatus Limnocylindria bacterium]|nr:glycoside hydrolase family 2 [Candidatus Limnocylindria bacterium]